MADIFDVIADGTRREILQLLLSRSADGERGTSVSHIVHELGRQPAHRVEAPQGAP